jgi:hypothetical protein
VPYHIVCSGLDGLVRFYDRRMVSVGCIDENEDLASQYTKGLFACFNPSTDDSTHIGNGTNSSCAPIKRITSLQYDNWGNELLVSMQPDIIYLLDWRVI